MAPEIGKKIWDSFRGGRYTRADLAKVSDDHLLIARDVIFLGDGIGHKRPGYTLVSASGLAINRMFDFRRQSDGSQFVLLAGAKLSWMTSAGGAPNPLSPGEDPNSVFDFGTSVHSCYASNGKKSYALLDVAGTLTKFSWGLKAPVAAPTIATGAGTLNLVQGRQYCYSRVRKWTDSQGVLRVHVGPPSPISAHTGTLTAAVVTVGAIEPDPGDGSTHHWIFATNDTPLNSSSVFFFAAEIAIAVTSWGDTLDDTSLDSSRQAPFDNQPAPLATIVREFTQRIVVGGIPGKPDLVQVSGLEECPLGITQECFPLSNFFSVPGGIKALTGAIVFNQALWLCTNEFWFRVDGVSADTFQEYDKVLEPGAAGKKCIVTFGIWMAWLGVDRKIWAWNGAGEPMEISWKIARADGSDELSMESLSPEQLANAELRRYNFGRYNVLVLLASTANNGVLDWAQLWDVSPLTGPGGPYGPTTKDGNLLGAAESDAFFAHEMAASEIVTVGNTPYLFLADVAGNIYRWPDGFTDAGVPYAPSLGSEFSDLDEPDVMKRMRFVDVFTSRIDALQKIGVGNGFAVLAAASDGLNIDAKAIALPAGPVPAPYSPGGADPTMFRGKAEVRGVSVGRFLRWWLRLPADDKDTEIYQVIAGHTANVGGTR